MSGGVFRAGLAALVSLGIAACDRGKDVGDGASAPSIEAAMAQHHVPGLALATLKHCNIDSIRFYGLSDVAAATPVGATTLFEAASLSKPVMAFLYLAAVERGQVTLDEPLARSFSYPRLAGEERFETLTARHLLTHRSGLPNWARGTLRFRKDPGTAFTYSGEGYTLLQAYLEARTGVRYEEAFAATLGADMPQSAFGFDVPAGTFPAIAYRDDGTAATERPLTPHDALSLRTVIGDYARFMGRVCRGAGLAPATVDEMFRPQSPAPLPAWREFLAPVGAEVSWTPGWGSVRIGGRLLHFHWGDNGAIKNMVVLERATGDGFVYFSNGESGLDLLEAVGDPIVGLSLRPIRRWVH